MPSISCSGIGAGSPSNEMMLTTPVHFRTGRRSRAIEARETVAGKQRPVDLLLAILPAAPARDRRQEGLDVLLFELLAHDLLVARSGPERVPADSGSDAREIPVRRDRRVGSSAISSSPALACSASSVFRRLASACSYAFFSSSLRQVMVACRAKLLEVLLRLAAPLLLRAILSLMSSRASSNVLTFVSVRDSSLRSGSRAACASPR